MQDVNIYIDTSIHGPTRTNGHHLYILEYIKEDTPITRMGNGYIEQATENQLALTAILTALRRLNCACDLRIHTSCQHIINAMNGRWARQWQKNEWRTAKGTVVKNADLWSGVLDELDKHLYLFTDEYHSYRPWMEQEIRRMSAGGNKQAKPGKYRGGAAFRSEQNG